VTKPLFSPSQCACGCGSLTVRRGTRFLHGHNRRSLSAPIALVVNRNGGYCECGCGTLAPIARQSHTARGNVRGLAMRFAPAHSSRVRATPPLPIFVDETDVDLLELRWTRRHPESRPRITQYAVRSIRVGGARKSALLHRVIAARIIERELLRHEIVDHIDGNGLNNRRSNLRVVSPQMNSANQTRLNVRNTTGFRGVTRNRRNGRFHAQVSFMGRNHFIGSFGTANEAGLAAHEWRVRHMTGYREESFYAH